MAKVQKPRVCLAGAQEVELAGLYTEHPDMTLTELAQRFNIGQRTVSAILRRQGVERRSDSRRARRTRIVELYRSSSYSAAEIATAVGCDVETVYDATRRMLSPEERRFLMARRAWARRKYRYRADLFAEPLSDDELWLFGLLMADGLVDCRGVVHLGLTVRDRDGIETARRVAGSDAPIVVVKRAGVNALGIRSDPVASWKLHGREIVCRVMALGMVPGKSYRHDSRVSEAVAQSASLWRGVIDGDGTICWKRVRRRERAYAYLHLLGGELLLKQWASFVVANIGEPAPRVRKRRGAELLHESVLSGSRAWRLLEIVYTHAHAGPALERKRKMALEILASPPPIPQVIPVDRVEQALGELEHLPLCKLPYRYVCPRTDVRLGRLVRFARRGGRPDLHTLFEKHDPKWRGDSQ